MLDSVVLNALRAALGPDGPSLPSGLITATNQLQTYECDGLTNMRELPSAVVLPRTAEQVQAIVRICDQYRIPFVARGAGTGLSGGALPAQGGIVISFARMNRILEIDIPNQRVVVEPGVVNSHVTDAVAAHGYFYAPDPSSQTVCTIGGNVAENAGGAHCLKYGFTTTHVLGMDVVLPNGELVTFGSSAPDAPGYDLTGVFVGSEGTLGVATKITLRIVKRPETVQVLLAAFDSTTAAAQTVSDIIAAGMLPAALEMMDRLSALASEAAVHPNYPVCEALLLVELDGPEAEVKAQMAEATDLCKKNGAWEVRLAQTAQERGLIWKGRKAAFAAMGRISPNYIVQDGVIPRTALPEVFDCYEPHGLRGSASPSPTSFTLAMATCIRWFFTTRRSRGRRRLHWIFRIAFCISAWITVARSPAEHGVGKEKQQAMGYMFSEPDLDTMQLVRHAFDPHNLANPDKLFPRPPPVRRKVRALHSTCAGDSRRCGVLLGGPDPASF